MINGMRIRSLAVLCAVVLSASGCGTGQAGGQEDRPAALEEGAMGRYVETFYELPEEINRNGGLNWLSDGTLTIISFGEGLYRSGDGGQTWEKEETAWFPMIQDVYCLAAVMGPDGTVAASCSGVMPKAAEEACTQELPEAREGNYLVFGMPDGTVKTVVPGFTQEDGSCIESFIFKEDGRLFAGDMQGKVYEVNMEKESFRELFMAERSVGCMDFSGNTLMAVGHDRLYLYDLQEDMLLPQDGTVDAFIRQALTEGAVSYTGGGYPLTVSGSGEKDVIYLACRNGMYRHVLGGSALEQVIDGALSTLGDPSAVIYRVKVLEEQEFLIACAPSVGLVRCKFDEGIPAMPDKELRIYSLRENRSVRQAMTDYKRTHTDLYIRYEVGLDGENGMTAEDALKRLNTQVLAGEGPDVLLLDGLPVDTWIGKGMLLDLRPVLEDLNGEDELFWNVVEGFAEADGAVYAMPVCIRVPLLVGDRDLVGGMEDLESIAEQAEQLRRDYPEGGIFGIHDAETMLRLFGMVSSGAWVEDDGRMDEAAVTEFLKLTKRIYDAEMAGAVPEQVERLEEEAEEMASYGTDPVQYRMEVCGNVLRIPQGYAAVAGGYVDGIQLCLDNVTSVLRMGDRLDYRILSGQVPDAFLPAAVVGIRSGTERQEEAEEFVRLMFSANTQENISEGFPVNRSAYEIHFQLYEENSGNGSMMLPMEDGTEQEIELYWPDQNERETFTEYVETLKTPVLSDDYLCGLVYESGVKVLEGERSAEEGAAEIVKKASIYLAE